MGNQIERRKQNPKKKSKNKTTKNEIDPNHIYFEIEKIPLNIFINIGCFLPISSILNLGLTCKKISKILTNEFLWKQISNKENGNLQEKPNEYETWKEFVKEGNFKWELNENNIGYFALEKNGKKIRFYSGDNKILSFVSETELKNGRYTFKFLVNCMYCTAFCIGVVNNNFNGYSEFICNSTEGRAVTGKGFIGTSDKKYNNGDNYCNFKFGNENMKLETETIFLVVDMNKKELETWNKNKPEDAYKTNFSDLTKTNEFIKLGITMYRIGESIEVLGIKWEK